MTKVNDRPENSSCDACSGMQWIPELDRRFILCINVWSDHFGHVLDCRHSCQDFEIDPPDMEIQKFDGGKNGQNI